MYRPRTRWVRSLVIVAGGAVGALVTIAVPANAATQGTGTVSVDWGGLNARTGAGMSAEAVRTLPNGTSISIECQVVGEHIAGKERTTNRWDRLTDGLYVSDAFVHRTADIDVCPTADDPGATAAQVLTGANGETGEAAVDRPDWVAPVPYWASPGFRTKSRPSHDGVDIMAPRNTPIRSVSAGTVITVVCNTSGTSCDVDGSLEVRGCGWYVEIRHAKNVVTRYCHLVRRPAVQVGETVKAGQVIGYVGTSGNSSGEHLHFEVHTGATATRENAVNPITFMRGVGAAIG